MSALSDALQNAVLFAGDAKSASGGLISIELTEEGFIVEAYDDHTYISTTVEWPGGPAGSKYFFSAKDVKELIKDETKTIRDYESHPDPGCFSDASEMVGMPTVETAGFYLSPDRWKKLGSLKPAGLPLKLEFHSDLGFVFGSFKYGNTHGLLSMLDESVLREEGLIDDGLQD